MPFTAEQRAVTNRIWAQVYAERGAHRAAREKTLAQRKSDFIGPPTEFEAWLRKGREKRLAQNAQAHIDAGGCSGDFCPICTGTGEAREEYDRGRWTSCDCFYCHGRGMGK